MTHTNSKFYIHGMCVTFVSNLIRSIKRNRFLMKFSTEHFSGLEGLKIFSDNFRELNNLKITLFTFLRVSLIIFTL